MANKSVLVAGESWVIHSVHQKGFDSFTTTEYQEGVGWLRAALEAGGWSVHHLPAHLAGAQFPATLDELGAYDCVILSDLGANTLLLHPDTFTGSRPVPDRLALLRDWVRAGGGLIMVGGYLSFQGIEGKARYAGTPVEEALPVTMSPYDDRAERPAGVTPEIVAPDHPAIRGVPDPWPGLLGYNAVTARPEAETIVRVGADPLLSTWAYGTGRAVAFTSDCGPHWAPPGFVDWDGYPPLWQGLTAWAAHLR
jgi:uncharacterized membrane protein